MGFWLLVPGVGMGAGVEVIPPQPTYRPLAPALPSIPRPAAPGVGGGWRPSAASGGLTYRPITGQ